MKRIGGLLVVLTMLTWAGPAFAQSTGAISGTVTASTGLALHGALITLRNAAGGPARSIQTQTDGSYVFTNLAVPGIYEIQAELQGFATVVHSSVTIAESQRLTVDFTLYAATAEALVVTGRVGDSRTPAIDRSADDVGLAGARVAARRPQFHGADVADRRLHRQCDRAQSAGPDLLEQQRHRRRREPLFEVARRARARSTQATDSTASAKCRCSRASSRRNSAKRSPP